jgi:AraC family transcriptional regulator
VKLTSWKEPCRVIAQAEIDGFYERPLQESCAFLFETGRLELAPHGGAFSLKLVLAGEEEYLIGPRTLCIRPGDILFVNAGETYGSRIRGSCRSLSLFFTPQDVVEVLRGGASRCDAAPELPQVRFSASTGNWRIVEKLVRQLQQGRCAAAGMAARELLEATVAQLTGTVPVTSLRHVRKRRTRDELIGRLLLAREYIESRRGERCTLDELARVACLSRFHFLRLFKDVFGSTPVAFARSKRAPPRACLGGR